MVVIGKVASQVLASCDHEFPLFLLEVTGSGWSCGCCTGELDTRSQSIGQIKYIVNCTERTMRAYGPHIESTDETCLKPVVLVA